MNAQQAILLLSSAVFFWTSSASAEIFVLPISKLQALKGRLSNQNVAVLSNQDQLGTADDWSKYIEVSAGGTSNFVALFHFACAKCSPGIEIKEIRVSTNTIGLSKSVQWRLFEIHNFARGAWDYLGDNTNAGSWVWFDKDFTLQGSDLRPTYMSPEGNIQIRFRSNNKKDVSNVDFLSVEVVTGPPKVTPGPTSSPSQAPMSSGIWRPKSSEALTWQWQLQGTLDTSLNVDMYDIDLFDTPPSKINELKDAGHVVVCYFSAGTYEGWRDDWKENFSFVTGDSYTGNEPPFAGNMAEWDERWLDIRRIDLLEPIMRGRMVLAKEKGCDAVEPDNVDAYTNGSEVKLPLTYQDQLAYNKWLADVAHEVGLSIGLKNDVDQLADLVDYFDWALNEQCFYYNECSGYTSTFIKQDKAVFGVEYTGNASTFCPKANSMGLSWLKKRLDLMAYREGCEVYL